MRGAPAGISILGLLSESNPKSKIQNRKWVGIFAIVFTFALCGARAEAQQPRKMPLIGYLDYGAAIDRDEAFFEALRYLGWI